MKEKIKIKSIGIIHTPYKEPKGIPVQGKFGEEVTADAEVFTKYEDGLKDIEGFSHIILVYYLDRAKEEKLVGKPFFEDKLHGVFATRSPHRPNHIGVSTVRLEKVEKNVITFSGVDMLDNTPLLDIKPYISAIDSRKDAKNGWLEKHFKDGKIPKRTKL